MILRSWRELRVLMKRMYPILTDEDFYFQEGEREKMLLRLQEKLNKNRNELEAIFRELQLS